MARLTCGDIRRATVAHSHTGVGAYR